jgi:hypothetical protein
VGSGKHIDGGTPAPYSTAWHTGYIVMVKDIPC